MELVSNLAAALADVKNTASGKVEYSGSGSMQLIQDVVYNLIGERMPVIDSSAVFAIYPGTEAQAVYLIGEGVFRYSTAPLDPGDVAYSASGGGNWVLEQVTRTTHLTDVSDTLPTNGQVLAYNTGAGKYVPTTPTAASIGWGNVTAHDEVVTHTNATTVIGSYAAGSVSLDATHYVSIVIDGVTRKLAIVT